MSLPLNKKTTAGAFENYPLDSLSAEEKEKHIEDEKNLQKPNRLYATDSIRFS